MDIKNVLNQIKEQVGKLNKKARILILALFGVLVAASIIIAVVLNNRAYSTLFTGLGSTEASEIMGKLQEMDVSYKYDNGTIQVPEDQEATTKAQLVSEGYPKSGLTYDVFTNNIGMMTTDFERNSYLIFDLQDRIAATIRHFDGVADAIVTIAVGEEQKYVLEEDKIESSASVVVIMENSSAPSGELVDGVVRLVANSVPGGISEDNISVLDGNGRSVSSSNSTSSQYGMSQLKLTLENEINSSIREEILYMLSPIFGDGQVRVSVNSTVDVDKRIREMIEYIPSEEGEENTGVISNETNGVEFVRDGEDAAGVPGTDTNAEVTTYEGLADDEGQIYFNDQNTIDYVVSQIKEQVQSDSGILTDLMVSVAVNGDTPNAAQMQQIRTLIARTAGIEDAEMESNIAIYFDNFAVADGNVGGTTDVEESSLPWFFWIVVGAILLIVVVAIVLMIIVRSRKNKNAMAEAEAMLPDAGDENMPPENYIMDINLSDIKKTREVELKNQITDFADQNPEISAQLIKTWLKGVEAE